MILSSVVIPKLAYGGGNEVHKTDEIEGALKKLKAAVYTCTLGC